MQLKKHLRLSLAWNLYQDLHQDLDRDLDLEKVPQEVKWWFLFLQTNKTPKNTTFLLLAEVIEKSNVCSIWDKENFYTFDGVMYTSNGRCGYQLISDCVTDQFEVIITFDETSNHTIMTIVMGSDVLTLTDGTATHNKEK